MRKVVLAAASGLLILAVVVVSAVAARRSAADRAHSFYLSAMDHRARFDGDGMIRDLRAAWTADPSYVPAISEAVAYYLRSESPMTKPLVEEIDSLAAAQDDPALGTCLRALLTLDRAWTPIDLPPQVSEPAGICLADYQLQRQPRRGEEQERVALARALWRRHPDTFYYATILADALWRTQAWEEVDAVAFQMSDQRRHPFVRIVGYTTRRARLHDLGRHEEAERLEREADAVTKRSGAAAVRLEYLSGSVDNHAAMLRESGGDSSVATHARSAITAAREEMTLLAMRADWWTATRFRVFEAERLLDNGELTASLREWNTLARLADSVGAPALQARVLVRRGRTLVKLGRTAEAERDLLAGRAAARRADYLRYQYEAEHNLLHLYEAAPARDEEARRAGEAFVALTRLAEALPVRLMSHRDLAQFHLRRGDRERARAHFETVVAYTDSLAGYDYWAGEYFELIGDLDRAEAYYRGPESDLAASVTRANGGLARLAEAIGDFDRAVHYARVHDEAQEVGLNPEIAPLLPGVLARHGRWREAAAALAPARDRANRRGQVAAWATLTGELGVLELRQGDLSAAAALSDSAAVAATQVAAASVAVRAGAIAGLARVRMGGAEHAPGLNGIRTAFATANRMRIPQLEAEIAGLYGEAVAAQGKPRTALLVLERAANLNDSIALSLSLDPARAGFRAAQTHVSNTALAVVLSRAAEPWAREEYFSWSVRRKNRGLMDRGGATPARSLKSIQRSLGPSEAVIDYGVLDSAVAALVLTDNGAMLLRLPVGADTLRAWVEALLSRLAPRVGTQVDTARSFFDRSLAHRLYAVLLAPLEPILEDRTRLTIVADGPLHLLPFDALVVAPPPQMSYVLDRYTVTVAPTLALSAGPGPRLQAGPVVAVAGPGVEGVADELSAMLEGFGTRDVAVLQGDRATETEVRRHTPVAGLLHFAAHARPNDAEPSFARLSLVSADGDDGRLHAYEIEGLRLEGTIVVLSACETGAGRLLAGEGVLSLSRAFLRAGASGTVATLWPVGPATTDLMGAFYSALARGEAPAAALREAKIALRRGRWASPFHWAGFTLVTQRN
ncbi:MAG TPA: CHAT domain-containing protein [Gemmatimonadales bacterium]